MIHASKYRVERYLSRGWPVVMWITYQLGYETPYWTRQEGHRFLLVPEEHAVTAIGFTRKYLIVNDPYVGLRRHYDWADFMRPWNYLERMALAVEPCRQPAPVRDIQAARHYWTITWDWKPDPGTVRYRLAVYQRQNGVWKFIKHEDTTSTTFTAHGTVAGFDYLFRVQGVAACGVAGQPQYSYSPARS